VRVDGAGRIAPAGWPLRRFNLDQLTSLLSPAPPPLLEISKDLLRDDVSLKALARLLSGLRDGGTRDVAFAGTTDLTACAGFSWDRYRRYLAVQIAQAAFLECSMFRVLAGRAASSIGTHELVARLGALCGDMAPIQVCVEIHAGVESDPDVLRVLIAQTPIRIVVDVENMSRAGLSAAGLAAAVPLDRVAYVHLRNLPGVWVEQPALLDDERRWDAMMPAGRVLWEPKQIDDPPRVEELFREYRTSH
jgi:hypothetical protein